MHIEYVPSWNWSNNCLAQSTIIVHSYCNVITVLHGIIFYLYTDVLNECFVMLMATTFFLCRWTGESECISLAKCRYISAARLVQVDAFEYFMHPMRIYIHTHIYNYPHTPRSRDPAAATRKRKKNCICSPKLEEAGSPVSRSSWPS